VTADDEGAYMFTTPCCGQSFSNHGHRCSCGHHWTQSRMREYGLVDEMFQFEEMVDLAEGNFLGVAEVAFEEQVFDGGFGF